MGRLRDRSRALATGSRRARSLGGGRGRVEIRIASGVYADESWPLRIDVPDVSLVGRTVLQRDSRRNLPVAVIPGTATTLLVEADYPYAADPHVIVATADAVEISGLVIDLRVPDVPYPNSVIQLDGRTATDGHLDRFVVQSNWLAGTQESSAAVELGVVEHATPAVWRGATTSLGCTVGSSSAVARRVRAMSRSRRTGRAGATTWPRFMAPRSSMIKVHLPWPLRPTATRPTGTRSELSWAFPTSALGLRSSCSTTSVNLRKPTRLSTTIGSMPTRTVWW